MSHHTKVQQIGYIRVSTVDQNMDRQLDDVELDKVFKEKISGKSIKRPELKKCIDYMRTGDTLHVHSMDRLARNLKDLQGVVEDLTGKGIRVQFHKENLTFTNDTNPMSKLMLQIMGAVAEFERSLIKERQLEGIAKAKQAGKHLGRKSALNDTQMKELKIWAEGGAPVTGLAEHFKVSRQTIYRLLKKMGVTPNAASFKERVRQGLEKPPVGPLVTYFPEPGKLAKVERFDPKTREWKEDE